MTDSLSKFFLGTLLDIRCGIYADKSESYGSHNLIQTAPCKLHTQESQIHLFSCPVYTSELELVVLAFRLPTHTYSVEPSLVPLSRLQLTCHFLYLQLSLSDATRSIYRRIFFRKV